MSEPTRTWFAADTNPLTAPVAERLAARLAPAAPAPGPRPAAPTPRPVPAAPPPPTAPRPAIARQVRPQALPPRPPVQAVASRQGARPSHPPARSPVSRDVALAVWEAESGRCEACGRAMDRRCARVARVDDARPDWTAGNLHLVCPDCKDRRPDPLAGPLTVAPELAAALTTALGVPGLDADAAEWLCIMLRRHAVLLMPGPRKYWLPGLGTFVLAVGPYGGGRLRGELYGPEAVLRVRPQARTRGLPRPDRRTHPTGSAGGNTAAITTGARLVVRKIAEDARA